MATAKKTTTTKTSTVKATASTAKAATSKGYSTNMTTAQVKAVQKAAGITQDGIYGKNTAAAVAKSSGSSSSGSSSGGSSSSSGGSSSTAKTVTGGSNPSGLTTTQVKAIQAANGLTQDGIIGPLTQAVINKGGSSGSTVITNNLSSGSTGASVKALQSFLANNQYVGLDGKPLATDGVYGNETKAAVMAFQKANGLTVDGIVGPQTIAKLQAIQTSGDKLVGANGEVPYKTGDPVNDALLSQLNDFIQQNITQGLQVNPDLNFDQATLDKFLETAKKQVHPFYQQQIDAIKADVLKAAPQILQNYESDIAGKVANFQNDLGNARESNAGAGLAFSGGRAKGELGALDAQNRDLASLSQTYGNKLYDLGRTAESKIGASATPSLGSLSNYSANLGGNGGFTLGGSTTPYTPGGYQIGSLTNDEQAAQEARRQALLKTASEAVVAGRSYQDLFA